MCISNKILIGFIGFLCILCTLPKIVNPICINKETIKVTVIVMEK